MSSVQGVISQDTYITSTRESIATPNSKWRVGARVNHSRYGSGVIVKIDDQYISVSFTKVPPMWYSGRKRKKTIKYIVSFEINAANDGAISPVKS